MLEETYEVIARKRESIRSEIDGLLKPSDAATIKESWKSVGINEKKIPIGAEDGSANHISYRGFALYAVNALAVVYDGQVKEYKASDVGIIEPYCIEDRLALYRSIFEIKSALRALEHSGLFLIDGSLSSDLGTPKHTGLELSSADKEEVLAFLPVVEERLTQVPLVASELAVKFNEKRVEKTVFLEYIEYLVSLARLLENGMDKLVGVSKTSTKASIIEGLPDMALYERSSREAGFSELKKEPLSSKLLRRFPVYDEFLNSLVFTSCYARLVDGKGVLMIELPMEANEGEVLEVLKGMRSVSVDGYPFPLRKAHREVVITNRDMRILSNSLGLFAKTGREVLNV